MGARLPFPEHGRVERENTRTLVLNLALRHSKDEKRALIVANRNGGGRGRKREIQVVEQATLLPCTCMLVYTLW